MAEQGGEVTIVGAGARLEGTVVSAGSLRIDGQVKGQINADGDVTLAPTSQVEADIRAQNVSIAANTSGTGAATFTVSAAGFTSVTLTKGSVTEVDRKAVRK